nr:PREDICTED: probable inactive tRNA-specific adenosine deaminase-like protein 3 [Anolis carolinensis]|eukprot:XP_008113642.1 PREDICTED: probable inactive tRNA-specific adenosine deaminase-like protein 3 [Anolis carolinensis]
MIVLSQWAASCTVLPTNQHARFQPLANPRRGGQRAGGSASRSLMEPGCKRRKTAEPTDSWEVVPVLSEQESQGVTLMPVYATPVLDKKEACRLVKEVSAVYPLGDYPHLKRIRACVSPNSPHPLEIIVCLANAKEEPEGLRSLSELFPSGQVDLHGLGQPFLALVPDRPPLTRPQYEEAVSHWPVSFHENKRITQAINGSLFTPLEKAAMQYHMELAIQAAQQGAKQGMRPVGAVVVDPSSGKVLAVGHDCRDGLNPIAPRRQGGGAYCYKDYPACVFNQQDHQSGHSSPSTNGLPYICTGYDMYLTREPCAMCAMSLVHSRIERVFYGVPSPHGALGTALHIHSRRDLNHRYEVFRGVLEGRCRSLEQESARDST